MSVDNARLRVVEPEAESSGTALGRSPGAYLKSQRLARGWSLDQLGAATKIPPRQLALLEDDRFDEMPAPVFAKGFLRCCARALKIDEDSLLGLLYEREKDLWRARRRESGAVQTLGGSVRSVRPTPGAIVVGAVWRGRLGRVGWLALWIVVIIALAALVAVALGLRPPTESIG